MKNTVNKPFLLIALLMGCFVVAGCPPASDPKDLAVLQAKVREGMTEAEVEQAVGKPFMKVGPGGPSNEGAWAYDLKGRPDESFQVWFRDGVVFWTKVKADEK